MIVNNVECNHARYVFPNDLLSYYLSVSSFSYSPCHSHVLRHPVHSHQNARALMYIVQM